MEHFGFLWAAYSIIFAVIFLYVVFIWRRQSRIESTISALEAKMAELNTASNRKRKN